ncbi:MAG: hypothetical protein ACRDJ9_18895, partial [Dehalococcoidia bacterium]
IRTMGHSAVESHIALLTKDPATAPSTTRLPVRLIQRESTAAAPVELAARREPRARRRHPPA